MGQPDDQHREQVAILWSGAAFMAVALIGHLLLPPVDVLWIVIGGFGLLAVRAGLPPAALNGRSRPLRLGYSGRGRDEARA